MGKEIKTEKEYLKALDRYEKLMQSDWTKNPSITKMLEVLNDRISRYEKENKFTGEV